MPGLIIKEKVGLEFAQEFAFGKASQEHRFIDIDAPIHEGANRALMRGGRAGSH
jgi:hypothetical protein